MKIPPKMPPLPGAGEKKAAPPVKPALEAVAVVAASGKYEAKPASATDQKTTLPTPSLGGNASSGSNSLGGASGNTVNVSPELVRQNLQGIDAVVDLVAHGPDSPIAIVAKSMGMTVEQYRAQQKKIEAEEKRRKDERIAEEARIAADDARIERENAELADWKDQVPYINSYLNAYVQAQNELKRWEEELRKERAKGVFGRTTQAEQEVNTSRAKAAAARELFGREIGGTFNALISGTYSKGSTGKGAQRFWLREVAPFYLEIAAGRKTVPDVHQAWQVFVSEFATSTPTPPSGATTDTPATAADGKSDTGLLVAGLFLLKVLFF